MKSQKNYEITLYEGHVIETKEALGEEGFGAGYIFGQSFLLANPSDTGNDVGDEIVQELAECLEIDAENDRLSVSKMTLELPEELVEKIRADAIADYKKRVEERVVKMYSPSEACQDGKVAADG